MDDTRIAIWANGIYRKPILSGLALLVSWVTGQLLQVLLVNRLSDDSPHIYVVREVTGFAGSTLAFLLITGNWLGGDHNTSRIETVSNCGLA